MATAVTLPGPPPTPPRIVADDGCVHYSHLKKLSLSGRQYLHAVNAENETTRPMRVSTIVHHVVLGPRADKKIVVYGGDRKGNAWKDFAREHAGDEIVTASEWADAQEMAEALKADPLVQARLDGARCEVPLTWEDGGVRCSTSGVDILSAGALGDLKGTNCAEPLIFQRQAFRMQYHAQLCWYRRGAIANGLDVSKGLFVLGYEMKAPFEVVDLELTPALIELGERAISLWLEKYRVYRQSNQWPGYVQRPIPWDVPSWMQDDEDDDEEAIS